MNRDSLIFNISIIVSAIIIAIGIFIYRSTQEEQNIEEPIIKEFLLTPVTEEDHIIGNPDAEVILVEYSDFTCPFCREFHTTTKRLLNEYGRDGHFALVYRHFPRISAINKTDSIAKTASIASECVSALLGKNAFWSFVTGIYETLPTDFTNTDLEDLAVKLGANRESYKACLTSNSFEEKINKHISDGLELYRNNPDFGTPYNIIVTKTGKQLEINGSESYSILKEIIRNYSSAP